MDVTRILGISRNVRVADVIRDGSWVNHHESWVNHHIRVADVIRDGSWETASSSVPSAPGGLENYG
ncbi:unnamed protein product [Arabis nemorensis]|uniref:Uncharacterized protein n=1 Tax=Arabis nemorensis TaxID=586526 RepID=A0A565CJG8_9BRAS|nr:unnamed protein product [Arabis nemorensis]